MFKAVMMGLRKWKKNIHRHREVDEKEERNKGF
jgi:hypothetical protein